MTFEEQVSYWRAELESCYGKPDESRRLRSLYERYQAWEAAVAPTGWRVLFGRLIRD